VSSPDSTPADVGRRAVLTAAAAAAVLATAGCQPFSGTKVTRTVTTQAPPPIDPMDTLIAMTRLHLLRLTSAVALGGATAQRLGQLRDDRAAHLTRLLQEQARVNRTQPGPAVQPGQSVPAPANSAAAMAAAADDAAVAELAFSDQLGNVSRYRAALFASISACLASHRAVLG